MSEAVSGTLVAVPADVKATVVDSKILVDRSVEPRLSVAGTATEEGGDRYDVRLTAGVFVVPTDSPEVASLEIGDAVSVNTVLTAVPAVGREGAGDDSIVAVKPVPEAVRDVPEAGSDESTEV